MEKYGPFFCYFKFQISNFVFIFLKRLDINRASNRVDDSDWIRGQICAPNTNYLLRGSDQESLSTYLCSNLNNSQLKGLFILISSQLDVTKVKTKIYQEVILDLTFLFQIAQATRAGISLQAVN